MKQTSDLLNELFAAWDYSPEGIVIRQDAPEWIRQCLRYICANMNELENQDILLVLHRFSAFALKHANKADKVDTSAYLDNAALLACEAIPDYLPPLLAWISYNQGSRAEYCETPILDGEHPSLNAMLYDSYMGWARHLLSHARDFILSVRDDNATA